jgi:hypothetical protein
MVSSKSTATICRRGREVSRPTPQSKKPDFARAAADFEEPIPELTREPDRSAALRTQLDRGSQFSRAKKGLTMMCGKVESRGDTLRIQLREPKWVDALGFGVGAGLTFAALITPNAQPSFVLWILFAYTFYYRWRRLGNCELVLSDRGILLQACGLSPFSLWSGRYYCVGVIPWENFRGAGVTRSLWTQCLGLSVADLDSFLNSRVEFIDEQTIKNINLNTVTAGKFARLIFGALMRLMGYTELPRSEGEVAMLEWNRENCGYPIVIFGRPMWFFGRPFRGGPKKVAEVISERARIHRT